MSEEMNTCIPLTDLHELDTITRLRQDNREQRYHRLGTSCCVCDQHCEVQRCFISQRQLHNLIQLYGLDPSGKGQSYYFKEFTNDTDGKFAKLRHWNLIRMGTKIGWWALTPTGKRFIEGATHAAKYIYMYNACRIPAPPGNRPALITVYDIMCQPEVASKIFSALEG